MNPMEQLVRQCGFKNLAELNRIVAQVDLTLPGKVTEFKKWQSDDGSKTGLLKLLGK